MDSGVCNRSDQYLPGTLSAVSWILVIVASVAFLLGCAVTWALTRAVVGCREIDLASAVEFSEPPQVPPVLDEVLAMLRAPAILVGPHDEVLRSTVPARTFGLSRGTRVGIDGLLDAVRATRGDGRARTVDIDIRRTVSAPAAHLVARVAGVNGDLVLVLAQDETQARRVDETRRDFVANVSHELKTPIGAIGLLAEAIEQASDDSDAVRHFAAKLHKESTRLAELVAQIIGLSRLQSDDPMLRAVDAPVDDIVAAAVDRSRELAGNREVSVRVAGVQGLHVYGDVPQLTDAVANLVQNAIVYSDAGAHVVVTVADIAEDGERYVDIAVSDNGIGIAPDDLERVFERFYRVDYGRSRANGGTGLGLSIVRHIAAVHGGSVNVWSQLGQGSTFTVRLPALDPEAIKEEETA